MTCNEVNGLLDLLMDGELSDGQLEAVRSHAGECPECAEAFRRTLQMKALFAEMESEPEVPLAAQAKWRSAVRQEARRRRAKRWIRWAGSAAAAVVVLIGVAVLLGQRNAPKTADAGTVMTAVESAAESPQTAALESALSENRQASAAADGFDAPESAVIESDGAAPEEALSDYAAMEAEADFDTSTGSALLAAPPLSAPDAELALRVEDVDTTCGRIGDLVQEYEGDMDVQRIEDGGANLYVDIPAANAADFLNAVAPMDTSGSAVAIPEFMGGGTVLLLLCVSGRD